MSKLNTIVFVLLSVASLMEAQTIHTMVWKTIEEFKAGGWRQQSSTSPGWHIERPSNVSAEFQPLDEGVTGGSVWSGTATAERLHLRQFFDSPELKGITSANLTIKYYYTGPYGLYVDGCWIVDTCRLFGYKSLEWHTAELVLEIDPANQHSIGLFSAEPAFKYLIDEVKISYTGGQAPNNTRY